MSIYMYYKHLQLDRYFYQNMNSRYNQERKFLLSEERSKDDINVFLKQQPNLDLTLVKDQKKNSVLHFCSFQNKEDIIKIYVKYMQDFYSRKGENVRQKIKEWVNTKNQQGFTAMHYSAYKGFISILQFLIHKGAVIDMTTTSGINNLHLAAQGNKVITFIYFRKKLDINQRDSKNSSALHWASYMGSESVVQYLLAQPEIQLNLQDSEGQTPMHLATAYGNTRIVRRLLIAGANSKLKNLRDQLPIKIAQDNQFTNIQKMLNDNFSCLDYCRFYCNIKIKYKPQDKSIFQPILFVVSTILVTAGTGIFLRFQPSWIDFGILGLIGIFLILYSSLLISPNQKEKKTYEFYLKQHQRLQKSCMQCIASKPIRSIHCDICKVCVQQYDHHCPWINNCVGKFNIGRFVCFLVAIILIMLMFIFLNTFTILMAINKDLMPISYIKDRNLLPQQLHLGYYIVPGIIIIVCLSFFVPLVLLLSVQIKNLLLNRTTFERYSKSNRSVVNQSSRSFSSHVVAPQPTMSISNCCKMCFGRQSGLDDQLVSEYSMISTQNQQHR